MTKEEFQRVWRQQQRGYAMIAKLRRDSLRKYDFWANRRAISSLMQMGADLGTKRTHTGLAEWNRRLGAPPARVE